MGSMINSEIYKDSCLASTVYKTQTLCDLDPTPWALEQNKVLFYFVCACTGVALNQGTNI
jgi:hypothetical protein